MKAAIRKGRLLARCTRLAENKPYGNSTSKRANMR